MSDSENKDLGICDFLSLKDLLVSIGACVCCMDRAGSDVPSSRKKSISLTNICMVLSMCPALL